MDKKNMGLTGKQITIIGVGNIGFRYLQAILKIEDIYSILLVEPQIEDLKQKLKREISLINPKIKILKDISSSVFKSDLIIVSTTSKVRLKIIQLLINNDYSGALILEKVLFPNLPTLKEGEKIIRKLKGSIYVNQWMRLSPLKQILMDKGNCNLEIKIKGNFGILCNSVHYIDLVNEIYKLNDLRFYRENSFFNSIINSKRIGFNELIGCLAYKSKEKNIKLILEDSVINPKTNDIEIFIKDTKNLNVYDQKNNTLISRKDNLSYQIPLLSEHSVYSIKDILNKKVPVIPSIEKSIKHHYLFLNSLKDLLGEQKFNEISIT